jgi:SAM-dependent methyltransferase
VPEPLKPALDQVRADILDAGRLVRAVAAGRRKGLRPEFRRAELRWVDLHAGRRLQVVTYDETQAFTANHEPGTAADIALDALLQQPYGNWHVDTIDGTMQVRVTKAGEAQVHRSRRRPDSAQDTADRATLTDAPLVGGQVPREHDRTKQRLLDPGDPVFRAVGITDVKGNVKPSRRDKYHQVEEFLRALEPVLEPVRDAAGGDDLRVVDLGCGNAYLSFAAYRWLTDRHQLPVQLVGVDVKAQARERNTALAASLGWSPDVTFVEGSIESATVETPPHLVVALHACDTATDDALARAVRWRAPVILAAPCCHHDIQRQLRGGGRIPAPYGPIGRHGILRERFADVLTDAVRGSLLRLLGYRVAVVEFVDSAHTPRNTLIRAVYTGAKPDRQQVTEYRELVRQWGVQPALEVRLAHLVGPIVGD